MTIDFEIIEKEKIETLKFPHSEVLEDDSAIKERTNALKSTLGNLEHSKFKFTLKMGCQKNGRNYSLGSNR
jgi:hypothetical protein